MIYAGFPALLGSGVAGQAYSSFLASTAIPNPEIRPTLVYSQQ